MAVFIGEYKEMLPDYPDIADNLPSMRSDFMPGPYDGQESVAEYLLKGGRIVAAFMGNAKDVFTGEPLGFGGNTRTDGVYEWSDELAHYVTKYNLKPQQEFVDHVTSLMKK